MIRATDFEFRNRFWVMGAIFWVGFFCYLFDHVNAGVALLGVHTAATSTPITVSVAGVQFVFAGLSYEMFGLDPASQQSRWKLQTMFGMAALLLIGAAMMRTWATAYLSRDTVQDARLRTEALVADGPYRYVRNPLYFSNVLMTLSMALLASRTGWLVIVAAMVVFPVPADWEGGSGIAAHAGGAVPGLLPGCPALVAVIHCACGGGRREAAVETGLAGRSVLLLGIRGVAGVLRADAQPGLRVRAIWT
jgi:protein-S-isoprenylcysteine O-methyltransferase Ste14